MTFGLLFSKLSIKWEKLALPLRELSLGERG